MGVTGLWKLIEPCGKPVPVETLEGKVLAIDISIWLHQVVKGFQDNKGAALNNAHLLGLFHRLCKLMYYRVKPVFVFDGCVPQLKKDTIARRQKQRSKLNAEADRVQALLLQALAREKVVQQALGPNAERLLKSPLKKSAARRKDDSIDDMFKLPDMPTSSKKEGNRAECETTDESFNESSFYSEDYTDDSSFDESNSRLAYNLNIQALNVRSKEFLQLPADVRHEILVDIKEFRKQSSWGRLHELPSRSDEFCNFQMKRLLKRRDVQISLNEAAEEMGGHTLTYAELTNIFSEDGLLEKDIVERGTKQISSDEHTRFLLVKDLKKKLSQSSLAEKQEVKEEKSPTARSVNISSDLPTTSKNGCQSEIPTKDIKLKNEYEADLELAIALSLEEDNKVYDEKDYEYDSGEALKLSKAQRAQLQNTVRGPARSYMIEYAGMNTEEIVGIMEKTQTNVNIDDTLDIERLIGGDITEKVDVKKSDEDTSEQSIHYSESQDICLRITDNSDDTDSDLEDVDDEITTKPNLEKSTSIMPKAVVKDDKISSDKTKVDDGNISSCKKVDDSDRKHNKLDEPRMRNNATDSDVEEIENRKALNTSILQQKFDLEDECVIEETPPFLTNEKSSKNEVSEHLNSQRKFKEVNDSNLEELKRNENTDSESNDDTDSDLVEVTDEDLNDMNDGRKILNTALATDFLKNKLNTKSIDTDDECVIEETPPCLPKEERKTSKAINIQIDLSQPLKPEDDLFADLFENKQTEEVIEQTLTCVKETGEEENSRHLISKENDLKVEIKTPQKPEKILTILDELKQQADEIKNIKLENIKLNNTLIEISDDESALKTCEVKNEIIEICDSDDNKKRSSTPPPQLKRSTSRSPKFKSKSPKLKTPSKNHSITDFFDINYVVKRTPDKPTEAEDKEVAKTKSPFFVHKTPKSGRKSGSNSPSPNKKPSKANRNLFENDQAGSSINTRKLEDEFKTLKEPAPPSGEDILNEAANLLKSKKTAEELNDIASDLAKEREELENERNRQDRMGITVTQRMNSDCQKLLRLFGVPFIVAPMEAEAQCAFLDMVQLTHGTITDDSDIWLFGGQTVYKNFFAQNKHVMEFRSEQIEKDFNCDRKKLIQLACLVGSDYTSGIHGIGAVTALEILASFTPKECAKKPDNSILESIQSILITLERFRNWWQSFKTTSAPPGSSTRLALQKKLKNIELYENFPNPAVVEAYLTPKVDDSKETFTWGYPDVESLKEFARTNFGWTNSKTNDILKPVLKKLDEKRTQQSIRNYFNVKNALSLRQIKVSKRVQNAIEKLVGNADSDDTPEKPIKAKRAKKAPVSITTTTDKRKRQPASKTTKTSDVNIVNDVSLSLEPGSSNAVARGKRGTKRASKRADTKEIIPQREKDLAQMEANKKMAAEILKKTADASKRKRKA